MNFIKIILPTLLLNSLIIHSIQENALQTVPQATNQVIQQKMESSQARSAETYRGTNLGLKYEDIRAIVESLRSLLADNYVLYTKALNFHWNVEGELFSQLHAFFKKLYEDLQDANDLLAERIRALGFYAPGSLKEFLERTQLQENQGVHRPYDEMLRILLNDHETVIRALRKATELSAEKNDWGTNNMLAGLLEKLEKNTWMIRSHLQKK